MAGGYALTEEVESQEDAAERLLGQIVVDSGLDVERRALSGCQRIVSPPSPTTKTLS